MKNSSSAILITLAIFFTSCSILGTNDNEAEAQFSIDSDLLTEQSLNLSFKDGSKTQNFSTQDFQMRENPTTGELATPIVKTSTDGKLTVEFQLSDANTKQQISKGSFQLDLKEDWRYSIYFLADSAEADPTYGCFGCGGYFSFKYLSDSSEPTNDSLFVVWGGHSMSNPVEY